MGPDAGSGFSRVIPNAPEWRVRGAARNSRFFASLRMTIGLYGNWAVEESLKSNRNRGLLRPATKLFAES